MGEGVGRCKTCKWWATGEEEWVSEDIRFDHDPEGNPILAHEYANACKHPKIKLEERPERDGASISNGWLLTGPEFGCILHEASAGTPRRGNG